MIYKTYKEYGKYLECAIQKPCITGSLIKKIKVKDK